MAESLAKETTSTEDLKTSAENSDFVIKVEDVSYPVHQNIIISSSEYFRGMLAHDTKERQDGFVEIKEIDSKTMKLCIDFMYDRDIDVTMETAKFLLPASEFLQLTELSKRCVDVLKDNLYSGNCITVLKLARAYNCSELAETALDIFKNKFKMENYEDFCKLDKEGLKQHITDLDMEIAWDGIINWIKLDVENRSSDIVELVKMLNWKRFPSSRFLYSVWLEPIFRSSEACRNSVFKNLLLSNEALEKELNVKNCLIICKIASHFGFLSEDTKLIILNFIRINLMMFIDEQEFKSFPNEIILDLLSLGDIGLCNETLRWKAAKNWMKHNPEQKDLMKCVRFDLMPKDYMKSTVLTDSLLNEPQKYVLQCLLKTSNDSTYMAVMYSDGVILAWNILDKTWYRLPDCHKKGAKTKMLSFRDKLCILVDGELFYLGKNETKWIPRATLKHRLVQFLTIVCSNDRIYVVEKNRMSSYDPDTNTWDESLPGCGLDGKLYSGCTRHWIIVRNAKGDRRSFIFKRSSWANKFNLNTISENGAIASGNDTIYIVGRLDFNFNTYQKATSFNSVYKWKDIKNIPFSIENPVQFFFVDDRLVLFSEGNFYAYDTLSDTWNKFGHLPEYRSNCFGKGEILSPTSICSFKGRLNTPAIEGVE